MKSKLIIMDKNGNKHTIIASRDRCIREFEFYKNRENVIWIGIQNYPLVKNNKEVLIDKWEEVSYN